MVTSDEHKGPSPSSKTEPAALKKTTAATKIDTPVSPRPPRRNRNMGFQIALLILFLVLLSLGAYGLFQIKQLGHRLDKQSAENESFQKGIQSSLTKQEDSLREELQQAQKGLKSVEEKAQENQAKEHYQKEDWSLLKTRSLLELAQINAHWSEDPKIALALLQNAFESLKNIKDPKVFALRQSIAKEISEIQALPTVDLSGLLSQLDALQMRVAELPIAKDRASDLDASKDPEAETAKTTMANWKNNLQKSLQSLGSLVVIKHHEGSLETLLTPLQRALIRESIRMNIQEAQWAALRNNVPLYQASLKKAQQNLSQGFETTATQTQSLMQQLKNLEQQPLSSEKPKLTQSLELINQIIDSKANTTNTEAAPTDPTAPMEGEKTL